MDARVMSLGAVWLSVVFLAPALAAPTPTPTPTEDKAAIQAEIWSKEQMIYAGRGRGDLRPYVENTSRNYVSWPPTVKAPMNYDQLAAVTVPKGATHEHLDMTFIDFALSGDTAVIYYRNHMTRRADGAPVDLTYDVTHTWTREDGVWRVVGGMARLEPSPAAP